MGLLQRRNGSEPRPRIWLGRPGRRADALVASGARAQDSPGVLRRLDLPWQLDALRRYDDTGECWNPSQYQARAMERIRYFPGLRQNDGTIKEVTSGPLLELWNRIRSPAGAPGDLSEIAGQYARLQHVIGDGLLTVSDQQGEEAWEYLSTVELRVERDEAGRPQEYKRIKAPGLTQQELHEAPDNEFDPTGIDQARVWRLWRRHPQYSQWADSPVRPIIDLFTLLNRLTLAVNAEASSRAAQRGLLFWPQELTIASVRSAQEENPQENPIMREFELSMSRAIQNPGSAEAMAPFFLSGPGVIQTAGGTIPTADLIKWIALSSGERYMEGEMWEKTISRIAASLDLPKEMLTGIEDVSHWSAWFLDEIGFRQHTGPTVVRFCNDIAAVYLRPAARAARIDDADRVAIGFDASQAINHPDETSVVADAHDRLVVSDAYYRQKIGATENDAPDEEELARRVEIKLRQFPSDLEREIQGEGGAGETPPPRGGRGGDQTKGPPGGTTERPSGQRQPTPAGPSMSLAAKVQGAAEMQIDRAREMAGNRVIRLAQKCADCQPKIARVPKEAVIATLGADQVRLLIDGRVEERNLVNGVGSALAERLRAWGIDSGFPEEIGKMVEQHALRTLYEQEPPPLPPGLLAVIQRACG